MPFNIACGRCRNCKDGNTGVCLNVNPDRPGSAYGYVDMGGWVGGQAEYVMVPYADWNLLKFPDKDQAMEKILDLTMLSDIFPTGYHGAVTAGVDPGSTVYVAGARAGRPGGGALGQLLGAAVVIVGDMIPERLAQAKQLRLRDGRHLQGRDPGGSDRADPRRARGRLPPSTPSASRPAATARTRTRGAGDGAQLDHGRHPGRPASSASPASTSPAIRAPSTTPPRSAACRSASASAGRSPSSFTTGQCPVMQYHRG